mgnify:CR=1 FL=1
MSDLTVEKDGPILVLTMNRPNRQNAMTLPMFARLADAWEMIDEDLDISCLLYTSPSPRDGLLSRMPSSA